MLLSDAPDGAPAGEDRVTGQNYSERTSPGTNRYSSQTSGRLKR